MGVGTERGSLDRAPVVFPDTLESWVEFLLMREWTWQSLCQGY